VRRRFTIENTRRRNWPTPSPRKAKRYKYSANKASICPGHAIASAALKQVAHHGETGPRSVPLVERKSSTTAPVPPEVHRATCHADVWTKAGQRPLPSHASELKEDEVSHGLRDATTANASRKGLRAAYVSTPGVGGGVLGPRVAHPRVTKGSNFVRHAWILAATFKKPTPCGRSCDIIARQSTPTVCLHLLKHPGGGPRAAGLPNRTP